MYQPRYKKALSDGSLAKAKAHLVKLLENCKLCPRNCGVNRLKNKTGECKTGRYARIASFNPHFGEEDPLVGIGGSGTIFFSQCNLHCNFCQNFDISHYGYGQTKSPEELATLMLHLQQQNCENINFVTPSHVIPQLVESLEIAAKNGLHIPIVFNSGAYDKTETLKILSGLIDIYMPDIKFLDKKIAKQTCQAADYPEIATKALKEMHQQVGDLQLNTNRIAQKGLLVRHLVMPDFIEDSKQILNFIANEISLHTYLNIMPQYRPAGNLTNTPYLNKHLNISEFQQLIKYAKELGFKRLD